MTTKSRTTAITKSITMKK